MRVAAEKGVAGGPEGCDTCQANPFPMDADYTIIGGGVVGLSVAWGLLKRGKRVTVLDGGDGDFRASRGNFGLIWVQSKGLRQPAYSRWTQKSANAWSGFADELSAGSSPSLGLQQNGGYDFFLDEQELAAQIESYDRLKSALGGDYPYEVLDPQDLLREEPGIGPKVVGALFHPADGHVNPLRLLHLLAGEVRRLGANVLNGVRVSEITVNDGFLATTETGTTFHSQRVILTAGLGAATLGPKLGFLAPIRPQRGQLLITERLPKLMNRPSGIIRQVDEGGVQIGASNEEVGLNDATTLKVTAKLAQQAVAIYPALAQAKLVRSWAALRIMSPDGLPIYQHSVQHPGAYLVTCHSGITLAAAHALFLPEWLENPDNAPDLEVFSERRFAVS